MREKAFLLLADLVKQSAADVSRSKGKDLNRLRRVEEKVVGHADGDVAHLAFNYGADGTLAGALRDGKNADSCVGERVKETAGHAQLLFHSVAYDGNDRAVGINFYRIDHAVLYFQIKLAGDRFLRAAGRFVSDAKADCVFRRRLGDEQNGNSRAGNRVKNAAGDSRPVAHSASAYGDDRSLFKARNAAHKIGALFAFKGTFSDSSSARAFVERVEAPSFDSLGGERRQSFWVEDF